MKDDEEVVSPHDGIYELDLATEQWKRIGSMKVVRFNHGLSLVGNDTWQYCQSGEK